MKTIKTRIIHKHAKASDWEKAINFVPLAGELIIYDPDETHTSARFKIGDGISNVNTLLFETISYNDLADKPFYEEGNLYTIVESNVLPNFQYNDYTESYYTIQFLGMPCDRVIEAGKKYKIIVDGAESTAVCTNAEIYGQYRECNFSVSGDVSELYMDQDAETGSIETINISVYIPGESHTVEIYEDDDYNIVPLDEKFIPDSIARVEDLNGSQIDIPLSLGYGEESIQQGLSAITYGNQSTALGYGSIAGCRGFRVTGMFANNQDDIVDDYYSVISEDGGYYILDCSYSELVNGGTIDPIGLYYSIRIKAAGERVGRVTNVTEEMYPNGDTYVTIHVDKFFHPNHWNELTDSEKEEYMSNSYIFFDAYPNLGDVVIGTGAHAEGYDTKAYSSGAHSEGVETIALGSGSHAEGNETIAYWSCHAEGKGTKALGNGSHSEGLETESSGFGSHSEGGATTASGNYSHAEGAGSKATNLGAHAEGFGTQAKGQYSHTEGSETEAMTHAHAEGTKSKALGSASHAEGVETEANSTGSHSEGGKTVASGDYAHAEGINSQAASIAAHAEGHTTKASGQGSHAEGRETETGATYAHAEGYKSKATGSAAHAEGQETQATQTAAHAEGFKTIASGYFSHAEGQSTVASKTGSHASGLGTKTGADYQFVTGKYNKVTSSLFVVGNGTDDENRSNAMEVTQDGQIISNVKPTDPKHLVNKEYIEEYAISQETFYDMDTRVTTLINILTAEQEKLRKYFSNYYPGNSNIVGKISLTNGNVLVVGDSIAADESSTKPSLVKWHTILHERAGILNVRYTDAKGGATFTKLSESFTNTILTQLQAKSINTRTHILVAAGTNDYSNGVSKEDFVAALNDTAAYINANKGENTHVIFITPINRTAPAQNEVAPLDWYRSAIIQCASENNYSIIDGSTFGFPIIECAERAELMFDGIHPNQLGHEVYADKVYNILTRGNTNLSTNMNGYITQEQVQNLINNALGNLINAEEVAY